MPSDTITTIECHYIEPEHAAAYLIAEGEQAIFVDNNTAYAAPYLLDALKETGRTPAQVTYVIVTHVHLDHSAGTARLLQECPNATVLCHPRASRHLIDPSRLVASSKKVYGEDLFNKLYGQIDPVPEDRIRTVEDNETLDVGERRLTFLHTRGHANHHICIHDSKSNSVFTGDSFGVASPALQHGTQPYIAWAAPPTDFDPAAARETVERLVETCAGRFYLTHFGEFTAIREGAVLLHRNIDELEAILTEAAETTLTGNELRAWCEERLRKVTETALREAGLPLNGDVFHWVESDIRLNSMGLAFVAEKRRQTAQG
ncbi:MAG: MBL fold metallo-hydrolase [Candidatus Hydrogenedentota bacterium]